MSLVTLLGMSNKSTIPRIGLLGWYRSPNSGENWTLPAEWFPSVGEGLFFDGSGVPHTLTTDQLLSSNLSGSQIFFGTRGLAVYDSSLSSQEAEKVRRSVRYSLRMVDGLEMLDNLEMR